MLQAYVVVAAAFVAVNASLSTLARRLERRQRRRYDGVAARDIEPILAQVELSQVGTAVGARPEE